jgi:hypothetical protein
MTPQIPCHTQVYIMNGELVRASFFEVNDGIDVKIWRLDRTFQSGGTHPDMVAADAAMSAMNIVSKDPLSKWRKVAIRFLVSRQRNPPKKWWVIAATKKGFEDTGVMCDTEEEAQAIVDNLGE